MTILSNIALQKADAVEIERRYSGVVVRRTLYALYLFILLVITICFLLNPTAFTIVLYVTVVLFLFLSIYCLINHSADFFSNDLVYDGTRLAWRPSFSGELNIDYREPRRPPVYRNEYLSYAFI